MSIAFLQFQYPGIMHVTNITRSMAKSDMAESDMVESDMAKSDMAENYMTKSDISSSDGVTERTSSSAPFVEAVEAETTAWVAFTVPTSLSEDVTEKIKTVKSKAETGSDDKKAKH